MTSPQDAHEALVEKVAPLFCCPGGCEGRDDCMSGSFKREARSAIALIAEETKTATEEMILGLDSAEDWTAMHSRSALYPKLPETK